MFMHRVKLKKAFELFFETVSAPEIQHRLHDKAYVTRGEVV